ncbi:hypothetical protein [Kaistella montana]|uniref:T9SS C-terminal target domain-containing protein n=1 Tax=Kaistella montana TaxID=1849733 RepID=A0ABW5K7R3_9FLAO|nr:hypothetical protein [Kaistella montana]MCQ4034779.1 hypothetical protein [Kaistella montana]
MMKHFLILIFSVFFQIGFTQQTDFLKIRKYKLAELSEVLNENSGLAFFDHKLYTFNDGGNSSEVFEINRTSGKIENIFKTNLINNDWEAMATDSANFYIGDFGNNAGTRKDLKIYKIPFNGEKTADSVQVISYFYPEQTDFLSRNLNNDFDAEAMIFLNGKIHVFTKEWASKATSHYIIDPEISENNPVQKVETFKTDYVVTDAAYFQKKLYLIGYTKKTEVFLSIFKETESGIFFKEKPQKYYLGSALSIGQIEGIEVDENGIFISGEELVTPLGKAKPALYFVPHEKMKSF